MNKKYEFTGEIKEYRGRTLHRIKRIKDGLVGGWIESEKNLSHEGDCFVYNEGMVYDDAVVYGNARVYGYAMVYDNAIVYNDARICDYAMVYDYVIVRDDAIVCSNAIVCDGAIVCGYATICDNARVHKGKIIGQVYQPYKDIFQYQCENRVLTAILTENDKILYSIGCQEDITKEQFLDRIYNDGGGLEENPHREEYLKLIPLIEQYFRN